MNIIFEVNYQVNNILEQQVQTYLRNEGNNIALADGLLLEKRYYYGPVNINLTLLTRCTGPEKEMQYQVSEESFNERSNGIIKRIQSGWLLPPILINYCDGKLKINDGNHRYEAYKRMNYTKIPGIFWVTKKIDYEKLIEWFEKIN